MKKRNPEEHGKKSTRLFDVLFSSTAVVALFPFMLPIMAGLKLTGEHYIFYTQKRVGKGEKEFSLLKFATMLKDSPNLPGGLFTLENDPRILPMGKFLRKTKINELPQLLNILKGDMSLIGYRPTTRDHYMCFPEESRKLLRKSLPGLSGLGSIAFRNEEEILTKVEDRERFYAEVISPYKAALECWYIKNKSLPLYFLLIALTAEAVVNPSRRTWKRLKGIPKVPKELREYI